MPVVGKTVSNTNPWIRYDSLTLWQGKFCKNLQFQAHRKNAQILRAIYVKSPKKENHNPLTLFHCFTVRLGAAATACLHKLQKGTPPWKPLKGFEKKTYKQLQDEAIESKKRDMAVLAANGGVWPGVRTPSHALFLWASGSEMTTILQKDHMPNKYISKELRCCLPLCIPFYF